jgi:hypothetical protein
MHRLVLPRGRPQQRRVRLPRPLRLEVLRGQRQGQREDAGRGAGTGRRRRRHVRWRDVNIVCVWNWVGGDMEMGRATRRIGSGGGGGTDVSSNGCRWRQDETNHGIHVTYSTLGGTIFTMTSMGVGKRFCKIYCLFLGGADYRADYLASGKASLKCRRMCISEPSLSIHVGNQC